jgi:hypothetical protein
MLLVVVEYASPRPSLCRTGFILDGLLGREMICKKSGHTGGAVCGQDPNHVYRDGRTVLIGRSAEKQGLANEGQILAQVSPESKGEVL